MRPIPLLAEEGAERERDSAKPQEWLRHQKNAAKPQRRRRRARSASAIARSRNTRSASAIARSRNTRSASAIARSRNTRSASAIARSRNTRSASAIARSRNSGQFGWPSKGRRTAHPVRDKSERIHFFDVADTPPLRGGECARRKTLSKKLKVAALLHKSQPWKPQTFFTLFVVHFCAFVARSSFQRDTEADSTVALSS